MNTANLQLEGLYLAIAAVNNLLVSKGVATREEIDVALGAAEATAMGDLQVTHDMSSPNRDAVAFPIRLLRLANNSASNDGTVPFSELARMVGETKHLNHGAR